MGLQQLVGYFCLFLALVGTVGGIWAAGYFSHARTYARKRARERATRNERSAG